MEFVELDGVALRYELSGKGERTLVLVHEMGGSLESWDEIVPRFAGSRRVLRYDTRGAGLSQKARGELSLDPGEALKGCYTAIRRDPGRWTADHDGAGTLRVLGGEMKCDRAADRHARKRHLAGDSERIEQRYDVGGHGIEAKLAAHLLRHAGPAGIVAQDAARSRELRNNLVPAFERAAHFVDEHQGTITLAAEFIPQRYAIQFNEVHSAFPSRGHSYPERRAGQVGKPQRHLRLIWRAALRIGGEC